jgi:hypothetical protein
MNSLQHRLKQTNIKKNTISINMDDITSKQAIIGRAETVSLLDLDLSNIPARVDTGAKTSALWASQISEVNGVLEFIPFAPNSVFYTGKKVQVTDFSSRVYVSSNGGREKRYRVQLLIQLHNKRIRATFSLADRSTLMYPILLGRNVLRGKFIVDVKLGNPELLQEESAHVSLPKTLYKKEVKA